jgi:hypothetical protein
MTRENDDTAHWYQQLHEARKAGILEERARVLAILEAELKVHSKASSGAGTVERLRARIEVNLV